MAKEKKVRVKSKTVKTRNALRVINAIMYGSKYAMPFVPATVMTIINWNEWFAETRGSLPAGFTALIIATIIAIIGIFKKDKLAEKKVSVLFVFALALFVVAASFLWLANVMHEAGMMFLYTACAVTASAVDDQLEKSLVLPRLEEFNEDIKEGGLDKKTNRREERKAKRLAEIEEAKRRAVE